MGAYLNFDDVESVQKELNERAHDLFKSRPGVSQLQVSRSGRTRNAENKAAGRFSQKQDVEGIPGIKTLHQDQDDVSQIFLVRQRRTWTTLDISRELFEGLLKQYAVFPQFWKCVFTFGRRSEDHEFEFPGFRARRTPVMASNPSEIFESAYVLRRVELNGRELTDGQSPWSIRQTGVYHRLSAPSPASSPDTQKPKSMYLLIAPSESAETQIGYCLQMSNKYEEAMSPWNMHRLLIADSLKNWKDYMVFLDDQLREQSNHIVLAKVGPEKENLAPLTDFNINFVDRQDLKVLEESILDLQVILSTMAKTITRIRDHCKSTSKKLRMNEEETDSLELVIDEFDEYIREAEVYAERSVVLKEKAHSTAQLMSDLLSYEEAVALKDLTRETQLESKSMHHLTERSTKDAAAVKILTVITLVYLPTTIVANFFSTQFVQTNEAGHMKLSDNAWLLAAIAVPLTVVTVALWGTWVYFSKVTPPPVNEQPNTLPAILRRRQSSFKSILTSRKKQRPSPKLQSTSNWSFFSALSLKKQQPLKDLEKGIVFTEKPGALEQGSPPPPIRNAGGTWSSDATMI